MTVLALRLSALHFGYMLLLWIGCLLVASCASKALVQPPLPRPATAGVAPQELPDFLLQQDLPHDVAWGPPPAALLGMLAPSSPAPGAALDNAARQISTRIMGAGCLSVAEMSAILVSKRPALAPAKATAIAQAYFDEACAEGVNHDVAFFQMCLETSYLSFGGDVNGMHQNNFCGLGVTGNGRRGLSFPDVRTGVRAHIQHLKGYACHEPLRLAQVDPRFKFCRRGLCPTIRELTGVWAMDPRYHVKLQQLIDKVGHRQIAQTAKQSSFSATLPHSLPR